MSVQNALTHLLTRDEAVPVQVVQLEGPAQLFIQTAPACDGQGAHKFGEFNGAILLEIREFE